VVRRLAIPHSIGQRLAVGLAALALMLSAELTVVLWLRKLTLAEYVASRDPVAGSVYLLSLAAFAAMPALVGRG
jgi:type IV secretory pathway TrbD component